MSQAWERAAAAYLARRGEDDAVVRYGNIAPDEDALGLLGDLAGRRVLDVGCGGGHNAVACARRGAAVTGVDVSPTLLAAAQRRGQEAGVTVAWVAGMVADVPDTPVYDLILACQALTYVEDVAATLAACHTRLAAGGRMVVALDHPLRGCFWDEDAGELNGFPLRAYDDARPLRWDFGPGLPMWSRQWTLAAWIEAFCRAGWELTRLVECRAPDEVADELWPEDGPLAPLRLIPHTAIFVLAAAEATTSTRRPDD